MSKIIVKNSKQIEGVRECGVINTMVLDCIEENIGAGISTEEIDKLVYEKTISLGGIPATLNYNGFPKSLCTSINDQVCHGIPSRKTILAEGDIINIDVSTFYKGYYADAARVFCIGKVSEKQKQLVTVAKEAVEVGLAQVKPEGSFHMIGTCIDDFVKSKGYSVAAEIGGHGIGLKFHESPWVGFTKNNDKIKMMPGMIFTIEPAVNMGGGRIYEDSGNGWTIYTSDRSPSAQWEVTVLVTTDGYEILSK